MIIKYYTSGTPENLYILEDCTDINVHGNIYDRGDVGPMPQDISTFYAYESPAELESSSKPFGCKIIDFTRKSIRSRLYVYGRAFICFEEGSTVEKVDPLK